MKRSFTWLLAISLVSTVALAGPAPVDVAVGQTINAYHQTNLVSDVPGLAPITDANLVNPWGLTATASSPMWAADNGSGFSTLYNGLGVPSSTIVTVPPASGRGPGVRGKPTGVVNNPTTATDFIVAQGTASRGASFIFSTEDGTISGWSPNVNATNAIMEVDNSNTTTGPVYKGLAIASNGGVNFLYAPNFRAGTVDVFDRTWQKVNLAGSFSDPTIPTGFAPFNVQALAGQLYVSYAKQDAAKQHDVPGAGNGYVNVFNTDGTLVRRLASGGTLNSPWGLAIAPANYGLFSSQVLVGNFGDGRVNAFGTDGTFLGQLQNAAGQPIAIDGLWALRVGNNGTGSDPNAIYFAAGIQGETHGLFGSLTAVPNVVGGRGFGISSSPTGTVNLIWQPGFGQSSYLILRLTNGAFSVVASGLSAAATSFADTTAPTGFSCYWLLALGAGATRTSDFVCATAGVQSATGVPQNFTLRMNQGSTASLTWTAPTGGGQDNFLLTDFTGGTQQLAATATSASIATTGFDCFMLQARAGTTVLGTTKVVCGQSGLSNLPT